VCVCVYIYVCVPALGSGIYHHLMLLSPYPYQTSKQSSKQLMSLRSDPKHQPALDQSLASNLQGL